MRSLLLVFVCFILISCQQRYGYVQKVKMPNREITEAGQPGENNRVEETTVLSEEIATIDVPVEPVPQEQIPSDNALIVELNPVSPPGISAPDRPSIRKPLATSLPAILSGITDDEPPGINLLMIAVFLVWVILFTVIVLGIAGIAVWFVFWNFLLGSGVALQTILLIEIGTYVLLALALMFSYIVGKRRIKEKLDYLPPRGQLLLSYFIALGITVAIYSLSYVMPYGMIVFILLLLLFIAAAIYALVWKKRAAKE